MTHYVFSLWGTTRNLATQAHLAHSWLEEEEEWSTNNNKNNNNHNNNKQPTQKKKKKIKLKISESSTLSLHGDVREYTLHILGNLVWEIYCNYNQSNLIDLIDLFATDLMDQIKLIDYHTYLPKPSYKYESIVLWKHQGIKA
jgi:hypothetical protein